MSLEPTGTQEGGNKWGKVRPLITTPEAFDAQFESRKGEFAGFTTLCLRDLEAGFTPDGLVIRRYTNSFQRTPCVNVELTADLHRGLFPNDPHPQVDDTNWLLNNNRQYGKNAAMTELYRELMGRELDNEWDWLAHLTDLNDTYELLGDDQTISATLQQLVDKTNVRYHGSPTPKYPSSSYDEISKHIQEYFGSEEVFLRFLRDLKDRGGVQIIYGNQQDFIDFARTAGSIPFDDNTAQIGRDIPTRFIKAIIPLGKYERERMGVDNI